MTTPPGASQGNSSFAGNIGSRLLGTSQLQSSLDQLTSAVQQLSAKMGGGQGWTGSGATFSAANPLGGGSAAGGGANGGGASFGGQTLNGMSSGGNGGWGRTGGAMLGGAAGGLPGALIGGAIGGGVQSAAAVGGPLIASSSNMSTYAQISAYQQTMALRYGNTQGAMNLAGFGNSTNNLAFNAQDAAQGTAALISASGSYGSLNSRGVNMFAGAGLTGITNPGMSFAQNAALQSQLYSGATSMQMMALGYGATPLNMRGGSSSAAQLYGGMMSRWYGNRNPSMAQLNAGFGPNGRITANLSYLGFTGANANAIENNLVTYQKLRNAGYTAGQINSVFTGATAAANTQAHKNAMNTLTKVLGNKAVNSITQLQKTQNAVSTQRAGDQTNEFQSGLAESSGLLNDFNRALNGLLNGPLKPFVGAGNYLSGLRQGSLGGGAAVSGGGGNASAPKSSSPAPSGPSGAAMAAVGFAKQELGLPYVWGGNNPQMGGFDCSGLVQWSYAQAGVNLPRVSWDQWSALQGKSIPLDQVQAGDILFAAGSDGSASKPGHEAMMVSNNQLIQAPYTGTDIQLDPYNPRDWLYAARPTGSGASAKANPKGGPGSGATSGGSTASTAASAARAGAGGFGASYADEAAALSYITSGASSPGGMPSSLTSFAGSSGLNGSSGKPSTSQIGGGSALPSWSGTSGLFSTPAGRASGGGLSLSVNVAQGAVVMNGVGAGGTAPGTPGVGMGDVKSAGDALAEQIVTVLEQYLMDQKIATGSSY